MLHMYCRCLLQLDGEFSDVTPTCCMYGQRPVPLRPGGDMGMWVRSISVSFPPPSWGTFLAHVLWHFPSPPQAVAAFLSSSSSRLRSDFLSHPQISSPQSSSPSSLRSLNLSKLTIFRCWWHLGLGLSRLVTPVAASVFSVS